MRKKSLFLVVCALTVVAAVGVAYAQYDLSQHVVKSTASTNKAGSKKKPAPFFADFRYDLVQPQGARGPAPITWSWGWKGVKISGKGFPVCTAQMIDKGQTASVCPKGSLLGTADFAALLGPEGNQGTSVGCTGKHIDLYNGGPNTLVWLVSGPPEGCAGLTYLAPFPVTYKTKKGTTTATLVFPDNIVHPLPGIEGGLSFIETHFNKKALKVKKGKGKKAHTFNYMSSTSCPGGKRTFTFTVKDSEGTHTATANAGSC